MARPYTVTPAAREASCANAAKARAARDSTDNLLKRLAPRVREMTPDQRRKLAALLEASE